jgi:hypothetical protein
LYSERVAELINLLTVLHDIPEPGLISPLLGVLVRMIPSIDLCLQVCVDILSRRDWYVSLCTPDHRLSQYAFKTLLKKHLPEEYSALEDTGALVPECLDLMFVHLFQSLLPFGGVARILDCYLLEGSSVLFDLGLGMIRLNRDITHLSYEAPPGAAAGGTEIDGVSSGGGSGRGIHPFWREVRRRFLGSALPISSLFEASFTPQR